MKSFLILLSTLLMFACEHQAPTSPGDSEEPPPPQWGMFGKNLRHTANAADPVEYYPGPQHGQIIWSLDFGWSERCYNSPVIGTDGTIYLATTPPSTSPDSGFVYAVTPEGTIKWRFKTEGSNQAEGALGVDGTYFIGSNDKHFYAIDSEGNLRWKRRIAAMFGLQTPAIAEYGAIIVPIDTGVVALSEHTGEIIWFRETPAGAMFAISLDQEGNIYTGSWHALLSLSPQGNIRWQFPTAGAVSELAIASDGTILFTVTYDSVFYALNPDGSVKWTFKLRNSLGAIPVIEADGTIVTADLKANLYRLSSQGQLLWQIDLPQLVGYTHPMIGYGRPVVDKDAVVYLTMFFAGERNLFAVSQDGELKWSLSVESPWTRISSTPAIAPDGTMYVTGVHSLVAIR